MGEIQKFPKREERIAYQDKKNKSNKRKDALKSSGNYSTTKGKKPFSNKNITPKNPKNRKRLKNNKFIKSSLVLFFIIGLIVIVIFSAMFRKDGAEVMVGETSIGIIKNKSITADYIKQTITAQLETSLSTKIQINEDITVGLIHIPKDRKNEVVTVDNILPKVRSAITYRVDGFAVMVEGERAVVLPNQKDAELVIENIKSEYVPNDSNAKMEVTFVEKVEVVNQFVDGAEMVTVEKALEKLSKGTKTQKTYTVQSNDSIYSIAKKADMAVEELLEINAGMTITTMLKVGQVVNITLEKPYISVKTVETIVMTDVEPKTYEYQDDSTKNKGYQKVIQQGRAGQKESTMQIIRINGFVEDEKEVSKKVTVDPVPEIILRGTK